MKNIQKCLGKFKRSLSIATYKIASNYRSLLLFMYATIVGVVMKQGASAADIFSQGLDMVNDVKTQLLIISIPACGVAVGIGVFFKKFSMGKQDKIELGNKLIKDSLIGWALFNSITYIIAYLSQFTSDSTYNE